MGLSQGSPYKVFMNNIIKKMYENGEMDKIFKKWKIDKPDCSPVLRSGRSVRLEKLAPLFMIVGFGVILAIILVFLEIITSCIKPKKVTEASFNKKLLRFKLIIAEAHKAIQSNNKPCSYLLSMVEESAKKLNSQNWFCITSKSSYMYINLLLWRFINSIKLLINEKLACSQKHTALLLNRSIGNKAMSSYICTLIITVHAVCSEKIVPIWKWFFLLV